MTESFLLLINPYKIILVSLVLAILSGGGWLASERLWSYYRASTGDDHDVDGNSDE